ncbi:MAG: class II aldolase/adducin family protein [Bacteroidales bacterium]|nr:class II aldolase/adducin family protein [Bacteroidales bacterium]
MSKIPSQYLVLATELSQYSHRVWERGYVVANGGNLSIKISENMILSTPSMESKCELKPEDMVISDFSGQRVYGDKSASTEILSHLAFYRANSRAKAIIHTHPPYTCSFAFTDSLPYEYMCAESALWLGSVCVIPYIQPGSSLLANEIERLSTESLVILMKNHGLMTAGETLKDAWWRCEVMENNCKISHLIMSRGDRATNINKIDE